MPDQHRVLIVDDDPIDRQAIVNALRRDAGIDRVEADVREADTIAHAREVLRQEEFACVFLDHDLPDGTSLNLLMELRSQGLATPVVVLTGQRDEQTIMDVMRAGAVDYLPKDRLHPDLVARSLRAALRFHQAEREKQTALAELRARDRAIAAASNGIVIADPRLPDCPLVYANAAFLRMTGYAEAEVVGRNCRFLQGPETDPAAALALREAIRQERACQILLRNYRKDGTLFWNELTVSPVRDVQDRLTHFVGIQTDVTSRQEKENERQQTESKLRRFQFFSDNANDALFLLDEACRLLYVNEATCLSLGYRAEELRAMSGTDIDPSLDDATYQALFRRAEGRRLPPFETRHRRRDGTSFPVEVSVSRVDISGQPLLFASGRNITERAERGRKERFLADLAERARGLTDPDAVIADAVDSLGGFLGASRVVFADIDLDADACTVPLDYRADPTVASIAGTFPISAFGAFVVAEYRAGRTAVVEDVRADPIKAPPETLGAYEAIGVRAYIAAPVTHSARLVSAVAVHSPAPRRWTPAEVTLVQAVVERTWLTVQVLRQQRALAQEAEEQRARAEREALLGRIGVTIRLAADPEQVLRAAVQELGAALGVDRCYYAAYDQAADTATVGPEWHREGLPDIAGQYPMSHFAVNRDPAYKAGRTQAVADTGGDTQALGLRALVRVPLVSGAAMTALSVAMTGGPRAWTGAEVSLAEAVATQTQMALEAVRVQRREHRIAEQLQEALQPALPEHVPGLSVASFTRPALDEASVGGDFYDIFPLDKELYAVVIGDVSGKGLAAAQQLALIRNSLRTTLYLHRAPARAAASLNAIITSHDLLVGFVTAWVGVYDAATGQITFCSCGHEPGLVRRADGAVEALETTGPPLGVAENVEYRESSLTLSAGDRLLLYTDGISESGPSRREMLGTDGLARLLAALPDDLAAQAETEALVAEVGAFTHGVFRDDVALLLARRL